MYFNTRWAARSGPSLISTSYPCTSTCYGIQGGKYAARWEEEDSYQTWKSALTKSQPRARETWRLLS